MKCEQVRDLFVPLVDGSLPPPDRSGALEHLQGCPECRSEFRRYREAVSAVRSLPRHPVSRSFTVDVLSALEIDRPERRSGPVWWIPSIRWAALVLLGIALAIFYAEVRFGSSADESNRLAGEIEVKRLEQELESIAQTFAESLSRSLATRDAQLEELARSRREELAALTRALEDQAKENARLRQGLAGIEGRLEEQGSRERESTHRLDSMSDSLEQRLRIAEEDLALLRRDTMKLVVRLDDSGRAEAPVRPRRVASAELETWDQASRDVEVDEEPLVMLREGSGLTLTVNWDHPEAIASLFELYDSGQNDWSALAYTHLDRHFRSRAGSYVRRRLQEEQSAPRGFWAGIFDRGAESTETDSEARLIELYREYWREQTRVRDGGGRTRPPSPDRF